MLTVKMSEKETQYKRKNINSDDRWKRKEKKNEDEECLKNEIDKILRV